MLRLTRRPDRLSWLVSVTGGALLLASLSVVAGPAQAAPSGTLSGTVTDSGSAPIGGIIVSATDAAGSTLETTTDPAGEWVLDAPDGDWTIRYRQGVEWSPPPIATPWMVTYYPGVWSKADATVVTVDHATSGLAIRDGLDTTLYRSGHFRAEASGYQVYDLSGHLAFQSPDYWVDEGMVVPPGTWKILLTGGPSVVPQWLTQGAPYGSPSSFEQAQVFHVAEGDQDPHVYDVPFPTGLYTLSPVAMTADPYGSVRVGRTLTSTPAVWNQSWHTSTRLAWVRAGRTKVGSGPTYRVRLADAGHSLRLVERARHGAFHGVSRAHTTVAPVPAHLEVTRIAHHGGRLTFTVVATARLGTPHGVVRGQNSHGQTHHHFRARLHHGRAVITLTDQPGGLHHVTLHFHAVTNGVAKAAFDVRL